MSKPKRHHFIPVTYIRSFCASDGLVTVYRKDAPSVPHRCTPTNTGLEGYYYSQKDEQGNIDCSTLERLFSELEGQWPQVVHVLQNRGNANGLCEQIVAFMALQRARVPAARDAYELMRADSVIHLAKFMQEHGRFPPEPLGSEGLLDRVRVSIDPQSSLQAMPLVMQGFAEMIVPRIGFKVLENSTKIDFITSDNPVVWYIPYKNEKDIKPYEMRASAPLEFLFPVSPKVLLYGSSDLSEIYSANGFTFGEIKDVEGVRRINRTVARFAYGAIYAAEQRVDALAAKYADTSPVLVTTPFRTEKKEMLIAAEMIFGSRRKKHPWTE